MPGGRLTPGRIWNFIDVERPLWEEARIDRPTVGSNTYTFDPITETVLEEAYRAVTANTARGTIRFRKDPFDIEKGSCVSGLKILAEKEKKICEDKST